MSARTGLCGGRRVTGIPTATPEHKELRAFHFYVAHPPIVCPTGRQCVIEYTM